MSPDSFPRLERHLYGSYHRHVLIEMQSHWRNLLSGESPRRKQQRTVLSNFRYRNFPFACLFLGALSTLQIISTYQEPIGLSL